jgi:hypothetical protein
MTIIMLLFAHIILHGDEINKAKSDKIRLDIKEVVSTDKELKLKYKIRNLSKSDVWVCMSSGEEKINKKMDTGIVKIVSEKDLSLILEVKSIPYDFLMDGPLGAFYFLIKNKESKEFEVVLQSPVMDNSDWFNGLYYENDDLKKKGLKKKMDTLNAKKVKDLIIRVGYYTKDLNSTKGCCVNPAKKYPPDIKKVYYDWAKENKEEVVEAKISLKNSESISGMKP